MCIGNQGPNHQIYPNQLGIHPLSTWEPLKSQEVQVSPHEALPFDAPSGQQLFFHPFSLLQGWQLVKHSRPETQQLDDIIDVTGLPNWFEKQVINVAPPAAGCDHGGLQFYTQGKRAHPAPSQNHSPASFARPHCLYLPPAALVPFLQPFGSQSKLCSQRLLESRYCLSCCLSCTASHQTTSHSSILSIAQRPPRSPHAPRVRPELAL